MITTIPVSLLRLAAATILPLIALVAQDKLPKWKQDPYTKNKPEALQKAGYVSYGPFPFGGRGAAEAQTTDIEKSLPYTQLRWIETAHFRIGMDLPEWVVPMDPVTRAKIRSELERLAEKLPGVDPKTRKLDPWLRAHLFAQRCEDLHAEFCAMAGIKDADFPQDAKNVVKMPGSAYMGYGPHLGMKDKYLVLLFESMTPFQTYLDEYLGRKSKFGQRWHFKDVGCLIFSIATECDGGRLKHDTALHCTLAFNLSQNLLDGFRYYNYDLPVWIREGVAHWFERRVDEKWNSYDQTEGSPADIRTTWKWKPILRGMVGSDKYRPFSECYQWRDFGDIKFEDHMAIWSRMDFLQSMGHDKWRTFLFEVKGRVNEDWSPNMNDLVGATRDALQKAYGISVLQLDEKWAEWVKANYPSQ
jgi:hypothetical protein